MNKNSSTSNSNLAVFLKKTSVFVSVVLLINVVLIFIVLSQPKKQKVIVKNEPSEVSLFGASNVGYDVDLKQLNNAKAFSSGEPLGLFLALDICRKSCASKTLVVDMPYSWYLPEKYAPATFFFYQRITPQLYLELFEKYPVICIKNFLSTNLLNTDVIMFLRTVFFKNKFAAPAEPNGFLANHSKDGYLTCNNVFIKKRHLVLQTTYNEKHMNFVKNEFLNLEKSNQTKVVVKYPELNKGNFKINVDLVKAIGTNFKTINSFEEWPDSLMFDQWYHLNACGREVNTANIQKALIGLSLLSKPVTP